MMDNREHSHSIMRFFSYDHLPEGGPREASKMCSDLANYADQVLPACEESAAGLRKLLEAKDCFVRAALQSDD